MFIVDVILTFFTSYTSMRGAEVTDSKEIAKHYMSKPSFYIDLLSVLGSDFLNGSKIFAALRFLKMLKISRLSVFVANLNVRRQHKAVISIIKLIL